MIQAKTAPGRLGLIVLEREPSAQLNHAVSIANSSILIPGASDAAERGWIAEAEVRIAEVWRVSNTECLSPEFKSHPLPNREVSVYRCVEVEISRTGELIPPHITKDTVWHRWALCGGGGGGLTEC